MPVEADQIRRLQGDIHRRAEGASEGHLPGGRLRLHQARRGTGADQRDVSALLRVAQTVQLKFLHMLCSPKSHRRQPVDRSVPSYRGHEISSAIPPAAAGGSFSPKLCFPLLNARAGIEPSTGCRRWDSRAFLAPCRPGLNDPPAAAGGIPESQNLCRNFSWTVCAAQSEIPLSGPNPVESRNFDKCPIEEAAQTRQFALPFSIAPYPQLLFI